MGNKIELLEVQAPTLEDTYLALSGDIFPVRHLAVALQRGFDPLSDDSIWPVTNWLVMAA